MADIAIIGGTGFIGKNIIWRLQMVYDKVYCISKSKEKFTACTFNSNVIHVSADLSRQEYVEFFNDNRIEYLIDLAYTTVPKTSFDDPLNDISSNLITTVGVFEWAKETNIKKLIWVSTGGAIYGQTEDKLLDERHPVNPISPYGITKLAIEKFAYMYYKLFNLPVVCLRPSNAYGPYQEPFRGQGFIATVIASILQNKTVQLYGESGTIRDYIHVNDLCSALIKTLENGKAGEVYNVGTGIGLNNLDILEKLKSYASEIPIEVKVELLPSRPFDVRYNVLDSTKLRAHTGWAPETGFDDGLRKTWEWYLKRYKDGLLN